MTATITSSSNVRLKALRRLVRRRDGGCFPVEGFRLVRCALDAGAPLRALYAAPALFVGNGEWQIVAHVRSLGVPVYEVGRAAFASVAAQGRPDGLLALVEEWPLELERLAVPRSPLVLVAEGVERPGNLGTMIRSACAAGATALVACEPQTDVFHPRAVTASAGALFGLPLAVASIHRRASLAQTARRAGRRGDSGCCDAGLGRGPHVRVRTRGRLRETRRDPNLARRGRPARHDSHARRHGGQPERRCRGRGGALRGRSAARS